MNMNTKRQGGGVRAAMLFSGATLLTFSGVVCAEPSLPVHAASRPAIEMLTDPQLAAMRGKYLAGDQNILYFGVQMVTQWQTPTGVMNASVTLGINRGGAQPVVTIEPLVTIVGTPSQTGDSGHVIQGGDLQGSHGVRQQIQVAGNGNDATNQLHVSIQPYSGSSGGSGGSGTPAVTLSQNGAEVTAGISGGQAGVTMHLGSATVQQMVGGGDNALQLIQLTGNQQQVQNQMNLIVGTSGASGLSGMNLLRQTGMAVAMTRCLR